jgi:cytochrome c556
MMNGKPIVKRFWPALGLALLAAPLLAAPADLVKARVAGYKQMGAAFKAVTDGIRSGSQTPTILRQSSATIVLAARNQYRWFPVASRPQAGLKTHAKSEIWSDPKGFRARQDAFARQAVVFQKVAAGGDAALIKSEARKLGAACKACHDQYRVDDD